MRVARAQIQPWPYEVTQNSPHQSDEVAQTLKRRAMARAKLISCALDPLLPKFLGEESETIQNAQSVLPESQTRLGDLSALPHATENLLWINCAHPLAEAEIIALHLYQAWQDPHKRAALVTPDRELARRVAAELKRFGIISNDSGGVPILDTPPGVFYAVNFGGHRAQCLIGGFAGFVKTPILSYGQSPRRPFTSDAIIRAKITARAANCFGDWWVALGLRTKKSPCRKK